MSTVSAVLTKICNGPTCLGEARSASEFYRNKARKDGLSSKSAYNRDYHANVSKRCSVEGCDKRARSNADGSFCGMHKARLRRHGAVGPSKSLVGSDNIKYRAAHARVQAARGSASDLICECGDTAEQWAYNHSCPRELVELRFDPRSGDYREMRYSPDPNSYDPMCRTCHTKRDNLVSRERKRLERRGRDVPA